MMRLMHQATFARFLLLFVALAAVSPLLQAACRGDDVAAFDGTGGAGQIANAAAVTSRRGEAIAHDLNRIEIGLAADVIRDFRASSDGTTAPEVLHEAVYAAALAAEGFETEARMVAEGSLARSAGADVNAAARVPAIVASVFLRLGLIDDGASQLRLAIGRAERAKDFMLALTARANLAQLVRDESEKVAQINAVMAQADILAGSGQGRRVLSQLLATAMGLPPAQRSLQTGIIDVLQAIVQKTADGGLRADVLFAQATVLEVAGNAMAALDRNDALFGHAARSKQVLSPPWLWQRARLLVALKRDDDARLAYRELVERLRVSRVSLEPQLLGIGSSFRERYGDAYLAYADLLIRAAKGSDNAARQALLREARDMAELTKLVEATDYFRDPCVGAGLVAKPVEQVDAAAVTLYPLVFADRIELLVGLGARLEVVSVPATRDALAKNVDDFRGLLEKRTTAQFMRPARRLYDQLIRPIEHFLPAQAAGTLVVIPDALLRGIPFSALHDGRQFLVEKVAVGTTVSISLTEPRRIDAQSLNAAVLGLTEARFGFSGLPAVKEETVRVGEFLRTAPRLDQAFTREQLIGQLQMSRPSVVHIASHGQFARDPRDSFLLTYDAKLDLDSLRRALAVGGSAGARGDSRSLELLMLSACQTATGDERAAMGLAGVALRSGARSALASLWFVNDESTAELSARFYQALVGGGQNRAAALRTAQQAMIADERFSHPAYWAPFLMIGSWL